MSLSLLIKLSFIHKMTNFSRTFCWKKFPDVKKNVRTWIFLDYYIEHYIELSYPFHGICFLFIYCVFNPKNILFCLLQLLFIKFFSNFFNIKTFYHICPRRCITYSPIVTLNFKSESLPKIYFIALNAVCQKTLLLVSNYYVPPNESYFFVFNQF